MPLELVPRHPDAGPFPSVTGATVRPTLPAVPGRPGSLKNEPYVVLSELDPCGGTGPMTRPIGWMKTVWEEHQRVLADLFSHCNCSEPQPASDEDRYVTTGIRVGSDVWTVLTNHRAQHALKLPEKHDATSCLRYVRFRRIGTAFIEWNKAYETMRKEQQQILTTFFRNAEILETEEHKRLFYGFDDFKPVVSVDPVRRRIKGKEYIWDLITSAMRHHMIEIVH